MKTINLFELATRMKLRFPFRGTITVEDLWDLSLKNLDLVFKALNAEAKQANEESLLATKSDEDVILEAKIAIVRHIVDVKQTEAAEAAAAAKNEAQATQIRQLIAKKQTKALEEMPIEALQAMLADLEK